MARPKPWVVVVAVAVLAAVVYTGRKFMQRGLRTNNPGNIKKMGAWKDFQGLAPVQDDPVNVRFISPFHGLRALCLVLIHYQTRHQLMDLTGILNRWAPTVENDTKEYVDNVSKWTGWPPFKPLDLVHDEKTLVDLARAIVKQENGLQPYHDDLIATAVQAAQAQG